MCDADGLLHSLHDQFHRCALGTSLVDSFNQACTHAYPRYSSPNVASCVRATLLQRPQFDSLDHLEDILPLRSRVLSLSSCFMRMERGPTTTIPKATLQGLIQLSDMHMSQLYFQPHTIQISTTLAGSADLTQFATCLPLLAMLSLETHPGPQAVQGPCETTSPCTGHAFTLPWSTCHVLASFSLII